MQHQMIVRCSPIKKKVMKRVLSELRRIDKRVSATFTMHTWLPKTAQDHVSCSTPFVSSMCRCHSASSVGLLVLAVSNQ